MDDTVRPPAPHGASPDGPVGGAGGAFDFLPPGFDLRRTTIETVRKYPVPCLLGAVALGFWIGRHRGRAIATAAVGLASNAVMRELGRVFDSSDF